MKNKNGVLKGSYPKRELRMTHTVILRNMMFIFTVVTTIRKFVIKHQTFLMNNLSNIS